MGKAYVFFVWSINNVGGGQLYVCNKKKYLENNGWDVYIVCGDSKLNPLVEGLSSKVLLEPSIMFPPYYFFSHQRNDVVNKILSHLPCNDCDVVCESLEMTLALWAEMISKELSAKHIFYLIGEMPTCQPIMRSFVLHKLKRKEFAGIVREDIIHFLNQVSQDINNCPCLLPWGANKCIDDVDYDISSLNNDYYTIGVFGRLNKRYMKASAKDIYFFVKNNQPQAFNIVYIGGEAYNRHIIKKYIKKLFSTVNNVNLFFTDNIYPVPRLLVNRLDVCVTGGTAYTAILNEGKPVIYVDSRDCDNYPSRGTALLDSWFPYKYADRIPVSDLLGTIMNGQLKTNITKVCFNDSYEDHMDFLQQGCQTNDYCTSFLYGGNIHFFIKRLVLRIFSPSYLMRILAVLHSMFE